MIAKERELVEKIWELDPEQEARERQWIIEKIEKIGGHNLERLAKKASRVRPSAYEPYSGYHVGAAILTTDGKVFAGVNSEVISYSETDHAETAAKSHAILGRALNRVGRKFIDVIAISHSGEAAPCGRCRQVIHEHADNCLIVIAGPTGKINRITSLKKMLPLPFGPSDLLTEVCLLDWKKDDLRKVLDNPALAALLTMHDRSSALARIDELVNLHEAPVTQFMLNDKAVMEARLEWTVEIPKYLAQIINDFLKPTN